MSVKDLKDISRILPTVGQIGLSIVVPIVFCVLICSWLTLKMNVGQWIFIPGFILGLGASFASMLKIYRNTKQKAQNEKKKTVAFNSHL